VPTRAVLIERFGPPGSLVEREVPLPEPGPGKVHVAVEAAGVNFADLLMRAGLYGTHPPLPFAPGFEIAGRVVRTGSGVAGLSEGGRVLALLRHGGYARDVIVRAEHAFPVPEELGPVDAAALPVVFLTAWVCLFRAGAARRGETALVLGAAGGVGTAAVQLAVEHGLAVLGTAGTPEKRAYVTGTLGAASCFDSRGDWESAVRTAAGDRGIGLALDPVGGKATAACLRLLSPLGRLVFYGLSEALPGDRRSWIAAGRAWLGTPRVHPLRLVEANAGIHGVHLLHLGRRERVLREAWAEILPRVLERRLRPVVDRTFPLTREGAIAAHAHLHSRGNIGKVVLVA